jgi:predicted nucleic acid-binding protein
VILLDTNVISALMRQAPETKVVAWLDRQPRSSVWTTSITLLELRFGLQIMAAGKKRSTLMSLFERMLRDKIENRVVSFDAAAALQASDVMAIRQKAGRPVELRDTMIAGIALASRATLATRNVRHFADLALALVDPWALEQ